ncbi:hypothetical protein HGRIS_013673 [Hohenbuehelia grisea]|uniref:Carboxymuconolactone decarboxylase-like domain-containing protein n=1 Tax=Hohenbuehelia grisea TaxID=104357 RepID=A0ABR3IW48_9AGAR
MLPRLSATATTSIKKYSSQPLSQAMTAKLTTSAFLSHLKSLYPFSEAASNADAVLQNPWYIAAAVAFSGGGHTPGVISVFQSALEELRSKQCSIEQQKLLANRVRDALFKSGLTTGYPKAIESLIALHQVMPVELREPSMMRDPGTSIEQYASDGAVLFKQVYGESAGPVQQALNDAYPDLGWFSNTVGYGLTYGFTSLLSPLETSYVLVSALISVDAPRQIHWHIAGARRNGASLAEIKAVREIAIEASRHAGVGWKSGVPEVADTIEQQLV